MKGVLKYNEPLAQYTSWHIGGVAEKYFRATSIEDIAELLASLPRDEPLIWLGLGSNVLVPDEGIKGTVIHTLGAGGDITILENFSSSGSKMVRVEAGIPCAKLSKFCVQNNLKGGEFFAGIPGTIGGALAMNAGAFGGETWQKVKELEVINRQGRRQFRKVGEYQISYRSVQSPYQEEWFVAGIFEFEQGHSEEASQQVKELLRKRNLTQPIGVFSCGSVFKNPPNDYAGRLIEASQLKGCRIGDAQVSPKHANFILNLGHASSHDIVQLIHHLQKTVLEDHKIALQTEVRIL